VFSIRGHKSVIRVKRHAGLTALAVILVLMLFASEASASMILSDEGISPNRSAEYVRTQSRNASTDADAIYYNPAGLVHLSTGGIYLIFNSVNGYTLRSNSINLRGTQGASAFSGIPTQTSNRYQSPAKYLSQIFTLMPTDLGFLFKSDNWSVFAYVSSLYGQPGLKFTQGATSFDRLWVAYNTVLATLLSDQLVGLYGNSSFEREEYHNGATAGGAYAITDKLSAALAVRYVNIQANTKVKQVPYGAFFYHYGNAMQYQVPTSISTSLYGHGAGIILGFDIKPADFVNIGTRAEYYLPMILAKKTNKFFTNPVLAQTGQLNLFCDSIWPLFVNDRLNAGGMGNILNVYLMDPKTRRNISNVYKATYPPSLSLGLSFKVIRNLRLVTSADLTFPRFRDLDGREKDWNYVGYRLGQAFDWDANNWITASIGYSYHNYGLRTSKLSDYDDLLASHTAGLGCSMKPLEYLSITLAGSYSYFQALRNSNSQLISSNVLGNTFSYWQGWKQKIFRNEWYTALGVTFYAYPVSQMNRKKAEEHYWKGMSLYLGDDLDSALDEFKSAKFYNSYFRDVGKKVKDLTELQDVIKKNKQQKELDSKENARDKKGKKAGKKAELQDTELE
jgi:hypothetical protein